MIRSAALGSGNRIGRHVVVVIVVVLLLYCCLCLWPALIELSAGAQFN